MRNSNLSRILRETVLCESTFEFTRIFVKNISAECAMHEVFSATKTTGMLRHAGSRILREGHQVATGGKLSFTVKSAGKQGEKQREQQSLSDIYIYILSIS